MNEETLRQNLTRVRETLASSAAEGGYAAPRLIAVTKTHPAEAILPLAGMGITDIGENRVQELREKLPALEGKFRVHLIGRLQTNKVKYIIDDVCLIQSVDRLELAREINRLAAAHERRVPVLVQVSPAGEPQKGGVAPEDVRALLREMALMEGLQVSGLMAVMPLTDDAVYLERLFRGMRALFEALRQEALDGIRMEELSMGMSGDYALAARCGATMVRVGSAIFGPRG